MKREFFSVKTVAEAQRGFRPARRTPEETVTLAEALGRIVARPVTSRHDLPGFARSALDGYAVRAADTFGASPTLPIPLRLNGEVAMGTAPEASVEPGTAVTIATGAPLPEGADAIVMLESTTRATADSIELLGAVAPGDAVVRADEDVAAGTELVSTGRAVRAQQLGLLASAGVTSVSVFRRPRVAIVSTGDELVDPGTAELAPGQIRDATTSALAALVERAGGVAVPRDIVPDDPSKLRSTLEQAVGDSDVVIVSAGSSVGARDATAEVVASLGPPGVWCHGLALKPGKPTLLAECGDVPVVGLPGNPVSALVVFGLLGASLVRLVGGATEAPPTPTRQAVLARDVPSAAGRLDVVQVALDGERAEPIFAKSSALSALAGADGQILVPEDAGGLYAGADVTVELHA